MATANKVLQTYRALWDAADIPVPSSESRALVMLAAAVTVSTEELASALKTKAEDKLDF